MIGTLRCTDCVIRERSSVVRFVPRPRRPDRSGVDRVRPREAFLMAKPSRPLRPASLADVAAVAGVSIMTDSRVANNGSGVGAATRERVLQIMADLEYQQNPTARALRTGRSSTLGIIF